MDTTNGRIYPPEQLAKMQEARAGSMRNLVMMQMPPTPQQMARNPPRVGRNEPCPCGSGKKFKRCCLATAPEDALRVFHGNRTVLLMPLNCHNVCR